MVIKRLLKESQDRFLLMKLQITERQNQEVKVINRRSLRK